MSNYPYRKGVNVILYDSIKKLFLIVRLKNWENKYFKFPGGGQDENETYEQTAEREIFEELGIKIESISVSKFRDKYDWPEEFQKVKGFRGQEKFYVLAYLSSDEVINLQHEEIEEYNE